MSADAPTFIPKLQIGEEDKITIVEKKQEAAAGGVKSNKYKEEKRKMQQVAEKFMALDVKGKSSVEDLPKQLTEEEARKKRKKQIAYLAKKLAEIDKENKAKDGGAPEIDEDLRKKMMKAKEAIAAAK